MFHALLLAAPPPGRVTGPTLFTLPKLKLPRVASEFLDQAERRNAGCGLCRQRPPRRGFEVLENHHVGRPGAVVLLRVSRRHAGRAAVARSDRAHRGPHRAGEFRRSRTTSRTARSTAPSRLWRPSRCGRDARPRDLFAAARDERRLDVCAALGGRRAALRVPRPDDRHIDGSDDRRRARRDGRRLARDRRHLSLVLQSFPKLSDALQRGPRHPRRSTTCKRSSTRRPSAASASPSSTCPGTRTRGSRATPSSPPAARGSPAASASRY